MPPHYSRLPRTKIYLQREKYATHSSSKASSSLIDFNFHAFFLFILEENKKINDLCIDRLSAKNSCALCGIS